MALPINPAIGQSLTTLCYDVNQNGWLDDNLVTLYCRTYPAVPYPVAAQTLVRPIIVNPGTFSRLNLTIFNIDKILDSPTQVTVTVSTFASNSLGVRGKQIGETMGQSVRGTEIPAPVPDLTIYQYQRIDVKAAFWDGLNFDEQAGHEVNNGPGEYKDVDLYVRIAQSSGTQNALQLPPIPCRVLQYSPLS